VGAISCGIRNSLGCLIFGVGNGLGCPPRPVQHKPMTKGERCGSHLQESCIASVLKVTNNNNRIFHTLIHLHALF
jgi:hypothetical protein